MKIFAKRTKKKEASGPPLSEADRAVLALLKKNDKDLNSKERRMIKRYHQRKEEEGETPVVAGETATGGDEPQTEDVSDEAVETTEEEVVESVTKEVDQATSETKDDEMEDAEVAKQEGNDDEDDSSSDSSSDEDEEEAPKASAEPTETVKDVAPAVVGETKEEGVELSEEDQVKELLEKLNSKNKRKLTRQLEREGKDALKAVREEALKQIAEAESKEEVETKAAKAAAAEEAKAGKKRKRVPDWSRLPPDERKRREDQRRMQQEAAERRAKEGENPTKKHKHPLNSERRRANRRKPKWKSPAANREPPNDHDISGFHMRRDTSNN